MSDYLDAQLAPAPRARFEGHLAECPRCRRLLAELRQTVGALRRLAAPSDGPEPIEIASAVRARLSGLD